MDLKSKEIRSGKYIILLIMYFLCFSFGTIVVFSKLADTDAFFLIVNGQEIANLGKVPNVLLHTMHPGLSTIIQQWIVSLINFGIYKKFGFIGLPIYSFCMYCLDLWLFNLLLKENGIKGDGQLVLGGIAAVLLSPFATSRPSVLSIAIITIELIVLSKYNKSEKNRIGLLLPLIALVEVNIHAALWWLIPIFALPYVFPIKGRLKKSCSLIGYIVLMFPASLINPNGLNGTLYLIKSYSSAKNGLTISELEKPVFLSPLAISLWLSIICIAIYIYKFRKVRTEDLAAEFLAAGTLILGVLHYRDTWMTLLGIVPLFHIVFDNKETVPHNKKRTDLFFWTIIVSISVMSCFSKIQSGAEIEDSPRTPVEAINYIKESNADNYDIDVFTEFGAGAFVELNGYNSYIDARPELFQKTINGKKDIYTEYCDLVRGTLDYSEFVNRYQFDYFIVDDSSRFETYLNLCGGYNKVISGEGYSMFEHKQ